MKLKTRRVLIAFVVLVTISLYGGENAIAETTKHEENTENHTIENVAEEYVRSFIMIQESGNQYDPKAEDFASIHGYIAAKYYKWRRDNNNYYSQTGIHDISVISSVTGRTMYYDDCCEVPVNIYYEYLYDGEIESAASETLEWGEKVILVV